MCSVLVGCSRRLDAEAANQIVLTTAGMKASDNVATTAISQSGENEAIAKTTVNGAEMTLKFRRYDNGWRWESAETKVGAWLAAAETVKQIREDDRRLAAKKWAEANKAQYEKTVRILDEFSRLLPRRTDESLEISTWIDRKKKFAKIVADLRAEQARSGKILEPSKSLLPEDPAAPVFDAWGSELLLHFDSSARIATFLSVGLDKKKGTADDVIVQAVGERAWDDFHDEIMFNYSKRWQVPEGLEDATRAAADKDETRAVNTVQVIQSE